MSKRGSALSAVAVAAGAIAAPAFGWLAPWVAWWTGDDVGAARFLAGGLCGGAALALFGAIGMARRGLVDTRPALLGVFGALRCALLLAAPLSFDVDAPFIAPAIVLAPIAADLLFWNALLVGLRARAGLAAALGAALLYSCVRATGVILLTDDASDFKALLLLLHLPAAFIAAAAVAAATLRAAFLPLGLQETPRA